MTLDPDDIKALAAALAPVLAELLSRSAAAPAVKRLPPVNMAEFHRLKRRAISRTATREDQQAFANYQNTHDTKALMKRRIAGRQCD